MKIIQLLMTSITTQDYSIHFNDIGYKTLNAHLKTSNYSKIFFAFVSKLFGKKVVFTQHNSRINDGIVFRFFFRLCDKFILVNDKNIKLNSSKYVLLI